MEITKSVLDTEIANAEIRFNEGSALVNKLAGALSVLKDLRGFLDREVVVAATEKEPRTDISPGNAEAQSRDEERAEALREIGERIGEAKAELIEDAEEEAMVYNPFYQGEDD